MDSWSHDIKLQRLVDQICIFFMKIFKTDEIPPFPDFSIVDEVCPKEQRFRAVSFALSAAIDVFAALPSKELRALIRDKVGLWRTLLPRLCAQSGADLHHIPVEIDIIASKNKLVIDSLIFNWPFCSNVVSDFLEFLCDSFHGSHNVNQPYIDDYAFKFNQIHKRPETIKLISLCIKWVHAIQGSPSYSYTKDILKESIISVILQSDVVMKNHENQFDEVWNEICSQLDNFDDFESTRIDSYPLYCSLNPLLKVLCDYMRLILTDVNFTDFSKILIHFQNMSEKYESRELWGLDLTNVMLTALNTVMTELLFRKCKSFSKISENKLKMFIQTVSSQESISVVMLMSEVNYWKDRLKRKKIELQLNTVDFFSGVWLKFTKESTFTLNLEEYFLRVLQNDSSIKQTPSLIGINKITSDSKVFQKLILDTLKNATTSLIKTEPYIPPITESKIVIICEIVEQMAEHYGTSLPAHFSEKINRLFEKVNSSLFSSDTIAQECDVKKLIIPIMESIDYKLFVSYIWRCINMGNSFLKPLNIQEYLLDLRHELFSQIQFDDADRIISRIMFYIGWRFKFRCTELLSDELFRFHLIFNFLGENVIPKVLIQQNLSYWMRSLQSLDNSKVVNQTPTTFLSDEFFECSKIDNVKNHLIQIFRGVKNLSIPSLTNIFYPRRKKGLESTKSLLLMLRQIFGRLNENDKHRNDTAKYWLKNIKAVETDLSLICCKLDADSIQVLGELNYFIGILRVSAYGANDVKKKKEDYANNESPDLPRNNVKVEQSDSQYSLFLKRKINSNDEDNLEKSVKVPKLLQTNNSYEDLDENKEDILKWQNRTLDKITLQSKVNFIDNSTDIALGDMIESRIFCVSEPNLKSICIDPGKHKSRPARYVEIVSSPYRNPITIFKKPSICNKRAKMAISKINELTSMFNFKLIRQVGQGSFGKVFEAVDKFSNIRVALKRTTLSNTEEGVPQSILREILILKSYNHSNIIQFHGVVVNDIEAIKSQFSDLEIIVPKSFYFVFEYMEHDLYGLLLSKSMIFSLSHIGFLVKQLFSALAHLHEKNIVHRDVIPSNILISNRGILKLGDFGNARLFVKDITSNKVQATTPKVVSYLYRAPEILLDLETYGPEVDIWSAGCVIYEMLTGKKLFNTNMPLNESNSTMFNFMENIAKVIGSPNQTVWPLVAHNINFKSLETRGITCNYPVKIDECMATIPADIADVLKQIFLWNPLTRILAKNVLITPWMQNVGIQSISATEFPEKDCHEYLLENWDKENNFENLPIEPWNLEVNPQRVNIQDQQSSLLENSRNSAIEQYVVMEEIEDEPLGDEDLKLFVESLSKRILKLSELLNKLRNEKAYSAEICKGVVMRAAREWSGREAMRIKLVPFMLDYLMDETEKKILNL